MTIVDYLDSIKTRLLTDPIIDIHLGPSQTVHPGTPINIFEVLDKVAKTLT